MTRPQDIVALMLQRSPRLLVPAPEMGRWRAFWAMRWQHWSAPPDDERTLRWFARLSSLIVHLASLAIFVVLSAFYWSMPPSYPPDAAEHRVRIGQVARSDSSAARDGADSRQTGVSNARQATPASSSIARSSSVPPAVATPIQRESLAADQATMPVAVFSPPQIPEVTPVVDQPARVTEVETPTREWVLPAPHRTRETTWRAEVTLPEVAVLPEIEAPESVSTPVLPTPALHIPETSVEIAAADTRVRERSIAAPLTAVARTEVTMPEPDVDTVPVSEPVLRTRTVEMPQIVHREVASAAATDPVSESPPVEDPMAATASMSDAKAAVTTETPTTSNAVQDIAVDRWNEALRRDDWGTETPASADGLFDGDGRVRLPETAGTGAALAGRERGAPGGDADVWTEARIARSGRWANAPPNPHTAGMFDQYWIPNESLLSEWVRKGITQLSIPIPGSSRRIECHISPLQFSGVCGIRNPNRVVQPATARPPPDIPFKPELQEDNGSVPELQADHGR